MGMATISLNKLHYVPRVAARSLRSKRTQTLVLLVPDIINPFWTTVARGVEDAAQSGGYSVLLCNTDENAAKQENYIKAIISQRVDGMIIAPYHSDSSELKKLRDREIPTIAIDRRVDGWEIDTVLGDTVTGSYALVRHLINLGHRRIAIISGPQETSSAEDRVRGYYLALEEANIPVDPDLILRGEYQCSSGEALTRSLLEKNMHPTAIIATNNSIALGAIQAINQFRLHIPQDLALVSFDDIPYLSELLPFLTVAVQRAYEMGFQAARLLLSRLKGDVGSTARFLVLPIQLIIRRSCGARLAESSLTLSDFKPQID